MRVIWAGVGLLALAFGVIGIVVPLLPTVPFLLLAAWCFARSSRRLHGWLLGHRHFGPMIVEWQSRGAIPRRVKKMASISMLAVFSISVVMGIPAMILIIQAVALGGAAWFIWTRPE